MNADILVIGAHPDDIELSCGATVATLVRQGLRVVLADLTEGELGTRGTREIRAREARQAAEILGVAARRNLGIQDGNIEINKTNLHQVISLIRELTPSIVICPHSFDRHPDHVHAHQLTREAWFYAGLAKMTTTLRGKEQKPHRPDNWFEFMQWHEFTPSFIVDVSETWEVKMKAVHAYESQFFRKESDEPETKLSKPEFLDLVQTRGRAYGHKIGVQFGEPFYSPVPIGISRFTDLLLTKG
ncbi:MAG: bacillithiol biosynthesis deacetylase BshB1 [Ignavibacteriales bacterium]|nr:bacillithiol biosynthesis deacetylase BshB1 [Ignavibacteriales bacterium]